MASYIARRLLAVLGVLWAMTLLIFGIVHLLPGNVAYMILGEYATAEAVATLEARLGLNDPLWLQYWRWFSGLLGGDFGRSLVMDRPAGPLIADALAHSAILAGISIVLVAIIGIALGIHSAVHKGTLSDRVLTLAQYFFIAVPEFFWCILLILLFAAWLGWLPATGYTPIGEGGVLRWATHLILPVFTLVSGLIAHVSRLTRSSMIETLESGYVLAARARGVPEGRVLRRHALPNALLPTVTVLAVDVGILIGGIVVVETVFAYPGLGRLLIFAIENHDLPLLMAGMMVVTTVYAVANLVADILYAFLNPRIRYGRAAA
ncbi:ABC transporter permease [Elioraea sp.]|uniref:ABC transporter permease n=1 Tax=Elioraea sp. TaxID=2185103 RepID=UPI0025C52614|nr:ABC transporter permease [Elioraea sp.]